MSFKAFKSKYVGQERVAEPEELNEIVAMDDSEKLAMLADLEQSGLGWYWATNQNNQLTYLSAAFANCMGLEADALAGKALAEIFTSRINEGQTQSLALKLAGRKGFSTIPVSPLNGNSEVVICLSGHPILSEAGDFLGYRGIAKDMTDQVQRDEETERLAKYDSLTNLANRHLMAQSIDATLKSFRSAKRNCAIMMLDLDRFKQVNDTLGHAAGDELLKEAASRIKRAAGSDCEIGRLGGDEFQIMLPDMDDRGDLGDIARRIITMLSQPYSLADGRCVIGASVGIAIAPHDGVSREEIVKSADMALYAAKNGGRGQFRFYSGDLADEALFRRRLEEDLIEAVQEEQLFARYQPIVSLASQSVEAMETQICWNHPQRGVIEHEEFQAIVENSSVASEVSQWAINRACLDALKWPESVRVAVYVPAKQFTADGFLKQVEDILTESSLSPTRLELEISEAVFLGDGNAVDQILHDLFKLGVQLTLDQFGKGHSSLNYLRRAPFSAIKIAPEFYQIDGNTKGHGGDMPLITALVALSNALGMRAIATEVETVQLYESLRVVGVGAIQGAIFRESVSIETASEELASGSWQIEPVTSRNQRARRRTVYRKIQVIHDDHSYDVTLRNLSTTGALIEGLKNVPIETQFVVDLGGGQLAVASVIRSSGEVQGLEFEIPLVEDGAGGLCTRIRVSPYLLASAGADLEALSDGNYKGMKGDLDANQSIPKFDYS